MKVMVNLTKSKTFFKIRFKKVNEGLLIITASKPKTKKQKIKLINALLPFEKKIIYPKGFNTTDYPAPYPEFEIKCKKMLYEFLNNCKKKRPDVAVITPNGLIKERFYFDLSEYVGKIVLNTKDYNDELKSSLLNHSGTVLEYGAQYDSGKNSVAVLNMPIKRENN